MIRLNLTTKIQTIIEKIDQYSVKLGSLVYVITGCVIYGQSSSVWGEQEGKQSLIFNSKISSLCRPYVEGKDIKRYGIIKSSRFISYEPEKMQVRPNFPEIFENPKIFVRDIPGQNGLISTFNLGKKY